MQREDREKEKWGECRASGSCKKSTPPESSWKERERRVKHLQETGEKNLFPETIDEEGGEGFTMARIP